MAPSLPGDRVRSIVENMPEGVVYSDREGFIRLWNRGAEALFGYRQEHVLGHTLDVIIPERCERDTGTAIARSYGPA
jgi:PAS domain S-box-containing protein